MEAKPPQVQGGDQSIELSRLLCFFCRRQQKLTPLRGALQLRNYTVTVDGTTYGVCPEHENDYLALQKRLR